MYHLIFFQTEPVFRHTVYILLLTCSLISYFKLYLSTEEESINRMGMTCVIITVIMFGSPLVALVSMCQIMENINTTLFILDSSISSKLFFLEVK